jgi:hypothetical protein
MPRSIFLIRAAQDVAPRVQALPQHMRGDPVVPMIRMPLGDGVDGPGAGVEVLVGQAQFALDSLAQLDDDDERVCTFVRPSRAV